MKSSAIFCRINASYLPITHVFSLYAGIQARYPNAEWSENLVWISFKQKLRGGLGTALGIRRTGLRYNSREGAVCAASPKANVSPILFGVTRAKSWRIN